MRGGIFCESVWGGSVHVMRFWCICSGVGADDVLLLPGRDLRCRRGRGVATVVPLRYARMPHVQRGGAVRRGLAAVRRRLRWWIRWRESDQWKLLRLGRWTRRAGGTMPPRVRAVCSRHVPLCSRRHLACRVFGVCGGDVRWTGADGVRSMPRGNVWCCRQTLSMCPLRSWHLLHSSRLAVAGCVRAVCQWVSCAG